MALTDPASGRRKVIGRLKISEGVGPVHAALPTALLSVAQLHGHQAAAVWPVARLGELPDRLVLHPIDGSPLAAVEALKAQPPQELRALICAWVGMQAKQAAAVSPLPPGSCEEVLLLGPMHSWCGRFGRTELDDPASEPDTIQTLKELDPG